jgi:hypothetical protein
LVPTEKSCPWPGASIKSWWRSNPMHVWPIPLMQVMKISMTWLVHFYSTFTRLKSRFVQLNKFWVDPREPNVCVPNHWNATYSKCMKLFW